MGFEPGWDSAYHFVMAHNHSEQPFFGQDLAYVHGQGFAHYWDGAADWLAELARIPGETPYAVDIGCGDGRMLGKLEQRHVPGCGFDVSESFVQAARARGLEASVADANGLEVPEATLVIALGEVLAYCNASGEVALERTIRSSADSLLPGGSMVFDVTCNDMDASAGWSDGDDWFVAYRNSIVAENYLERRITVFVEENNGWRRTDEVHRQKLLDTNEVEALLLECGLRFKRISAMGDVPVLPGRAAYLAKKPKQARVEGHI